MTDAALRLVREDEDGNWIPRELDHLNRQITSLKRMLHAATEELNIERETVKKYARENTSLKARLTRQEAMEAQDDVVSAVFEFWKLMTVHPRAKLGAARTKAINGRIREGATPKDFFKAIVGAAWDSYTHPETGKRYDDLELICRNEANLEARIETYYRVPDVRAEVDAAGAVDVARALMDLERRQRSDG